MAQENIKEFPITIFGNLEKITDTISLGRARIFYKGLNRNGTYISEEFAESLMETFPYSPVKGIFKDGDFSDHGKERDEGRAYGVGSATPNFAWEWHLDEDGVEREYACADVIIWTALYHEASDIVGKSQSMELYAPSIEGEWQFILGKRVFKYTNGVFLGLQVLGDDVEPCFEGSSFYSLHPDLEDMIKKLYSKNVKQDEEEEKGGEESKMSKIIFELSNEEKRDKIFTALNPKEQEYYLYPIATYDTYVVAHSWEKDQFFKVKYSLTEDETIVIGEQEEVFVVYATNSEKTALEALRVVNGDTFESIDTNYATLKEDNEKLSIENENFSAKVLEQKGTIATLTTEKENTEGALNTVKTEVKDLKEEVKTLNSYKLDKETEEKEAVITRYSEQLDESTLAGYREKISEFTVQALEKDLAYELVQSKPSLFTENPQYIPKDHEPKEGIIGILESYQNK